MIYHQKIPPCLGRAWRVRLVLLAVVVLPILPEAFRAFDRNCDEGISLSAFQNHPD